LNAFTCKLEFKNQKLFNLVGDLIASDLVFVKQLSNMDISLTLHSFAKSGALHLKLFDVIVEEMENRPDFFSGEHLDWRINQITSIQVALQTTRRKNDTWEIVDPLLSGIKKYTA
jgi:hypothetical protein